MRKENGILQRLGALLLTFAMLVSMCPMKAAAAGDEIPLKYRIVRTTVRDTESSKDPKPILRYEYSVEFDGVSTPASGTAEYWWYVEGATEQVQAINTALDERYGLYFELGNETITNDQCRTVMLNLKVDGLTLVGSLPSSVNEGNDGRAYSDWFTWGAVTTGWPSTVKIGVPFTLNAAAPDGNSGIGDTTITTDDVWGMFVDTVDGKYVPTLNNTPGTGTLTRKHSVNGTGRATENLSTTISWPDYNATFALNGETVTGDTAYISEASTITVTIPDSCGVEDAKYLPLIASPWSKEGTEWKTDVLVDKDWTIAVGNETLKVVVDGETPKVTNVSAYVDGDETVVKFDYSIGTSGIGSLTINGTKVTAPTASPATIRISDTTQTNVSIALTSKAGKTGTANSAVTPALDVKSCVPDSNDTYTAGGTSYIKEKCQFKMTVAGVPDGKVTVNGEQVTVSDGTGYLAFEKANGQTLTVEDSLGRKDTYAVKNYVYDNTAPTVTYTQIADTIYGTEKNMEFKAEDNVNGSGFNSAHVVLEFTNRSSSEEFDLTGADPQKTVTLKDGDVLTHIKVTEIKDNLGNQTTAIDVSKNIVIDTTAPKVTLTASGNIETFATIGGKQWAILPPVTGNGTGAPEAVSITASIEDKNMDASVLTADGWSQDGTTFTKTFLVNVDKQANGVLSVSIPAIDKAGNKPASVTVQAKDNTTAAFAWDVDNQTFADTLHIDRRIPSESEDGAPKVTFSTTDTNYGTVDSVLYKNSVTFTATIQDGGSGLASVEGSVNDSKLTLSKSGSDSTYQYEIAATDYETASAQLSVTVKDNVGNGYTYTHAFAIDAKAPVVSVTPNITEKAENAGVMYYDADVTYTVSAADLFPKTTVMKKDGVTLTSLPGGQFTVADAMDSFEVSLTDKVGKSSSASVGKMVVDKVDPMITVTIQDAAGKPVTPADRVVNSELTYHFKVTEPNLKALTLKYKISDGAEQTKTLTDFGHTTGSDLYTWDVPLADGESITSWSVTAEDWAGRTASAEKSGEENLLVDITAPVVEVTESETPLRSNDISYFDEDTVTYTITVKDANLDADKTTARAKITGSNGSDLSKTIAFTAVDGNLVGTFALTDGLMLSELTIDVQDQGTNRPEKINAPDVMTFTGSGGVYTSAYEAVVDTTAPTATLSIVSKTEGVTVTGIYTFGGRNYLKLTADEAKDVTVKATLKLSDANLTAPTDMNGWEIVTGGAEVTVNNANNVITLTNTLTAEKDNTNSITLSLTEKDVLGHPLKVSAVSGGVGDNTPSYETAADGSGIVTFDLTLDNRAPTTGSDSEAPVITVAPETKYETADGKPLYNKPFSFTATVKEDTANKSGLDIVYYEVTDGSSVVTEKNNTDESDIPDGVYEKTLTIPVALAENPGETNSAKLRIQAKDNSGNGVALVKDFAVDNKAPRVSVEFNNNSVTNDKFFRAARKATVTVEDINLTEGVAAVSGSKTAFDGSWDGAGSVKTNTMTFDPGDGEVGEYTMSLQSTDLAQNTTSNEKVVYTGCKAPNSFIIDRKAPTVNVTRTSEATAYTTTGDGPKTDFYNKPVTYSFKIQDNYLDNAAGGIQKVSITYTVNGTSKTVSLPAAEQGLTLETIDGLKTYTYSFTLDNEDVLSGITIEVVDNAGNSFREITGNVPFTNGIYTGHVKVDTVAPVVKVEREGPDAVQTVNDHEFFGTKQTFTVTVSDDNLVDTNGSLYKVFYTVNGEQKELPLTVNGGDRTASFTVNGGVSDLISAIQILVKDAAGNSAVLDGESPIKTFAAGEDGLMYNGNKMVVDCLAPTATFYATGPEIEYYYTNGSDAVFIKLKDPTDGTETDKSDVEVTAVLEVSDWNLSINKDDFTVRSNNGGKLAGSNADAWSEGVKIHKDGKVVYTKTFSVPYNETRQIQLDMDISDMAGHELTQSGLTIQSLNGTIPDKYPLTVNDGNLTGAITLDRRQPTSGNDTEAPYIKLTPKPSPVGISSNGRKLFNSSFEYSLYVTDSKKANMTLNAGLKSVVWTLEKASGLNGGSFITVNSGEENIAQGVMETNKAIKFTVGTDECNTCELHVTAEDYVGNKITYVEPFAVDTLAPRVKVEYDNNDVRNELYFKANRKATITVEDINFDVSATKINTQVGSSGWTHSADGKVHTAVCSYTVDGEYTFTMETTDRAGNTTADNNVTYVGAAHHKFILDKTRPVIEVFYNPAEHTGMDDMGTLYYNVNTTATVRIKEHNFRANDVISEFNNGKKLGTFTDGGNDSHSASVLFDQNNRYQFRIAYTDLAGNLAEPYTSPIFSVDTTAPVIDITEGDMTNEHLNIVSDDLVLQIRVMDQESNLESYAVKITYQNNSFEWITLNSGDYWTVTSEDGGNTIYINFANILKEKSKDGIYCVEVYGRDYAGNVTELAPPLVFSLNRFGSSFMSTDQFTIDFLRPSVEDIAYHNSVDQKLVFQEINPNRVFEDAQHKLEGSTLTLMVNGASRRLQRNQDYTVTSHKHNEDDQAWFEYTYTIDPSAFMDGGELRNGRNTILIYGEDEAGNQNTNESNTSEVAQMLSGEVYTGKIEFVLDTMSPIITTVGIESNTVYNAESQQMKIDISDSTPVALKVYLNDQELTLSQEPADNSVAWMTRDETMGTYTVNVPQDNNLFSKQTLRVTVVDAANNEAEAYVREFYVSTNPFIQLMNNIWLLGVCVLVLAGVIFLTVVTIRKRKTKAAK